MSPDTFFERGKEIFRGRKKKTRHQKSLHTQPDLFRAFFGTWPATCSVLWEQVDPCTTIHPKSKSIHLPWALFLMHNCATECVNAAICGVDEDTFRKWSMPWIPAMANLTVDLLDFNNGFQGNWHCWTFCVDGAHCPMVEPRLPFWKGWCSHKWGQAGLVHEIATAVSTGWIIWVNGPFPAGKWPDFKILSTN